uniref:BZIP domain-containing protein n=1 Tax=Globodera pallida TaxID=36090 RepID=A0A183CFN3_GLOPA
MAGTLPQFGANGGAGTGTGGGGGGMAFLSSSGGSGSSKDQLMFRKRFKEMEKRRKAEEEALHRKSDAETDVKRLERELEERMIRIHSLRVKFADCRRL